MRTSPRSREKLGFGFGQELFSPAGPLTSRISFASTHADLAKTPTSDTRGHRIPDLSSAVSSRAVSEIASEIIVQGDEMDVDEKPPPASEAQSADGSHVDNNITEAPSAILAHTGPLLSGQDSFESPMSRISDQSELSSLPSSSRSSKATTPVDTDGARDPLTQPVVPSPPRQIPRRTFDVKPKSSIPADIDEQLYAGQCIEAAESCRLDPFSLHQEEYHMLRQHITHPQVTTYLNIRNSILRLWILDTRTPVTRKQAVGCAGSRWFDVASICYDWLVRRGFINFGCLKFPPASPPPTNHSVATKQNTIVIIGAGMSGLGCARQLTGLAEQYADRFRGRGELPPRVLVLEGRARVGGRVYSRQFQSKIPRSVPGFDGERHTAEMGGMIITGFERGNPINVLLRGQLGLDYRALRSETTIYDSNGRPVDFNRDSLVEKLYNDCLDRVSEYKHKTQPSKLIRGNQDLIEHARDSHTDGSKTISQAEEAAAALPHALPVSQQNVPERVNRVPVSSDKVTGRVHTEPGTPATQKASDKAKDMGWKIKNSTAADATIDLTQAVAEPDATLGSVLDEAIMQYRSLVDLTAQDHRLINWHIANLEYSNATNLHNLSLPSWDIDAGNEWDGKHTMVVGGYQSVPRGLAMCPTPLDLKTRAPVNRITYQDGDAPGKAVVECEDGTRVEADFVVSTIPLGVLKQPGSVTFDPPLPQWKQDVISRMGFGVLNKVILVYKEAFWDPNRNIFGVLRDASNRHSLNQSDYAASRGRFFQWFNVSDTTGLPCLVALMAGDAGFHTERESNDMLVDEATRVLRSIFGRAVPQPLEAVVTRWQSDRFARGSYSSSGPHMHPDDYNDMARHVGNLYFAGEHTIGTHPATVHGAYMSGLRAAAEIFDAILGPIDLPSPLVLPKDNSSTLKRKTTEERRDPKQERVDEYELAAWDFIISRLGPRPLAPVKVPPNAYMLYNKATYESAKRRCEEERAGSKRKVGPNDVRVMTSRLWRAADAEERAPFDQEAQRLREEHAAAVASFNELSAKWDWDYVGLRAEYDKDHPFVPMGESEQKHRRTGKTIVYAEDSENSDQDL